MLEAQLNFLRKAFKTPNDPLYPPYQSKYMAKTRFPQAWNVTIGSTAMSVAVVDTGVDLDHPDFKGRLKPGYDFVNDDAMPQDDNGHGTMVAGIAAAATSNAKGVAAAAWRARVIPVKVLDASGVGTDAQVASGITWAADQGAKVINLSLGGPDDSPVLRAAVEYAFSKNVVVVAAAGNEGSNVPQYPAAFVGVVAVAATTQSGSFTYFSSYGWWVNISAPGMFIASTFQADGPAEDYAIGHGTSFAAPLVSGAALLVRVRYPTLSQSHVRARLLKTAWDRGPSGIDPFYGWGLLDAYAAVGGKKQAPAAPPAGDSLEPNGTMDKATKISSYTDKSTISPEGDVDWFVKPMTSTGSVRFEVTPAESDPEGNRNREMDPVISVYGPNRKLLGRMDSGFLGEPEIITVPASSIGNYYLEVQNYVGSQSYGAYTVSVITSPAPLFDSYQAYRPGGSTHSTAVADVTGDGLQDLLVTSDFPETPLLFLYPQNMDGSLADPISFPTDGWLYDLDIATGDLNGDELTDVAVAAAKPPNPSGTIDVYYQSSGSLAGPVPIPVSSDAQEVEIADVDGDGREDMVVQTAVGLVKLINSGSGFTEGAIGGGNHTDIDVGDLNGDGRPDVAGTTSSGKLEVFVQEVGGSFMKQTYDPTGGASGLVVADVTGDGRNDVVVVGGGNGGYLNVFAQNPGGTLDAPTVYRSYDIPVPVEAEDLNGDGLMDLVVGHHAWERVGVYMQQASGGLTPEALLRVPYGNYDPTSLSLGDLNGDELPDIAIADSAEVLVIRQQASITGDPAWVRGTYPDDFATGRKRSTAPSVTFAGEIDPASINTSTVYMRNGVTWSKTAVTLRYDPVNRRVRLDRSSPLTASTPWVVFVAGVKDIDGNVMPAFTFRFKTGTK